MTFTIPNIINGIGSLLEEKYPQYPVHDSPNRQGSSFPCFFIFLMPSTSEDEVGSRYLRDLGIDIVFVQERNVVDQNAQIYEIAEFLDESLDMLLYSDGSGQTALIHTFERQWQIEDQELHYQFHIRQRVKLPEARNPMTEMEENNVGIKE